MSFKYSFVSLGCPKNTYDSQQMLNQLQAAGFLLVPEGSDEDAVIVNTCAFVQDAVFEAESVITELCERKVRGEIRYVIVCGCYPSRFRDEAQRRTFSLVDAWVPIVDEPKLTSLIQTLIKKTSNATLKPDNGIRLTPRHYAYLKIAEGCHNYCSYCTIPLIRGAFRSRTLEAVLTEAQGLLDCGVKEVILVAEDTTRWGEDLFGTPSLPMLLSALAELPFLWIRIMYAYPSRVDDALIAVMLKYPNICRYLDMPVQHVSDRVLKVMNRSYTRMDLIRLFQKLYAAIPDLAVRTTCIVGFPTETDADFNELLDFVETHSIHHLGAFVYSDEAGTCAYTLEPKISEIVATQRLDRLMRSQKQRLKVLNQGFLKQCYPMIYEGDGQGRIYAQAPDIDSVVKVNVTKKLKIGQEYLVNIRKAIDYDLYGSID